MQIRDYFETLRNLYFQLLHKNNQELLIHCLDIVLGGFNFFLPVSVPLPAPSSVLTFFVLEFSSQRNSNGRIQFDFKSLIIFIRILRMC
jgi:hypothetical protein